MRGARAQKPDTPFDSPVPFSCSARHSIVSKDDAFPRAESLLHRMSQPSATPLASALPAGVRLCASVPQAAAFLFSPEALAFWVDLERRFGPRRRELLARRERVQAELDAGWKPDFLTETQEVRDGDWRVAPLPADLLDRRVEITGPVDRKMVINALNSGANVFMADFEDASSPTFANMVDGQANLHDAVRRQVDFTHPDTGKRYALRDDPAVLFVRPRGWHLDEAHLEVDGAPASASLFDFAMFVFHNARELVARGSGPYLYLPKLENHLEARLWNEVFVHAQAALGLPTGTIKATVLIETILAAFEMDEILWELRDHSAGLNCGRWDYIFSFIKRFRADPEFVVPDRGAVGMDRHFLKSYSQLLIRTCHRRGVHAMGGMAAQIPIKNDDDANAAALGKVRADKEREAEAGHDGTWVAHPALVQVAREVFDARLASASNGGASPAANQLHVLREDVEVDAADLLRVPTGPITEAGLRQNLRVGIQYLEAWLRGSGCVPIEHLMEDAATAEISRTQLWQWRHHGACLDDGRAIDADLLHRLQDEELEGLRTTLGDERFASGRFGDAAALFERLLHADELEEFLTLVAYDKL